MNTELNNKQKNPLAAFGQRPTPPAGSRITEIVIKDDDHNGYFDRIKWRYAWMPLHDVNFIGRMQIQPMSTDALIRGRIAWIQSVSYKAVDNSPEAMDIDGEGELPLKNFLLTPYAQCMYLYGALAEKGVRVFEHLKGVEPQIVARFEEIILPEVPYDLLALGKYLTEQSHVNIENSGLEGKEKILAEEMLVSMQEGVNTAMEYCLALIEESENEIMTRRNKGVGKAALDKNDKYAYAMLSREVPTESTLANSPERKTNELLERLVEAIAAGNTAGVKVAPVEERVEEVDKLRAELDAVRNQLAEVLFAVKNLNSPVVSPSGAPTLEDETVVDPEVAAADLKARLADTKSNPRKGK